MMEEPTLKELKQFVNKKYAETHGNDKENRMYFELGLILSQIDNLISSIKIS